MKLLHATFGVRKGIENNPSQLWKSWKLRHACLSARRHIGAAFVTLEVL